MPGRDPAEMFRPGAWVHPDETDDREWDDEQGHYVRPEHICGWTTPQGRAIRPSECAACTPQDVGPESPAREREGSNR